MLGLFLILPVFAVHAMHLKGGDNHTLVGIALGAYGLTQGVLQIPYGMASDRYGRKRIIILGLVLFALGSFIAAIGDDIYVIIAGRAIQGAGAISAPVMAFLADLTREQHRTKAMALVGSSIGLMFALSLVGSPLLYRYIGMGGIFVLTGVLALVAIWVVVSVVPEEALVKIEAEEHVEPARLGDVLRNPDLLRLNFGIFSLHVVQMAMFVVVPLALVSAGGLSVDQHWKVYLPVVLASFVLMLPPIFYAEKKDRIKPVFLACVALMAAGPTGLRVRAAEFHRACHPAAGLLRCFQCAGGEPAVAGVAHGAGARQGHGARRVQHDAVAGPVRRRRRRRLADAASRAGAGVRVRRRADCAVGNQRRRHARAAARAHARRGRGRQARRSATGRPGNTVSKIREES